jgi:hypothetical protein
MFQDLGTKLPFVNEKSLNIVSDLVASNKERECGFSIEYNFGQNSKTWLYHTLA